MTRHTEVAIVGNGPAGCIAAWACHLAGAVPTIYSPSVAPGALPGAQYLHSPFVLPGNRDLAHINIRYVKMGSKEDYSRKIYGENFDPSKTSWDLFPSGVVRGWPLHHVYEQLFHWAQRFMVESVIDREKMTVLTKSFPLVFNSAPAALFAGQPGDDVQVETEEVYIRQQKTKGWDSAEVDKDLGLIIYEGDPWVPHYRYSYLEGVHSWEYPNTYPEGIKVAKPLRISHPPMASNIVPIGRYGRWEKGVLVDGVFKQVSTTMDGYFGMLTR